VLAHRLVLTTEAHAARRSAADVVHAVLHRVPVPQGGNAQSNGQFHR
jgi:MoxR-like ATPase